MRKSKISERGENLGNIDHWKPDEEIFLKHKKWPAMLSATDWPSKLKSEA